MPLPGAEAADDAFAAAGWSRDEDVLVLTAPLNGWSAPSVAVDLSPTPDEAWLAGYRYRRRGLAGAVMAALGSWARERRGHSCVLQVAAPNAPALALYDRLGFTEHHRYHYRLGPETRRPPA